MREPEEYKVGEILRLTEGSLAPVACLEADAKPCVHVSALPDPSHGNRLNHVINEFFDSYTIADLMQTEDGGGLCDLSLRCQTTVGANCRACTKQFGTTLADRRKPDSKEMRSIFELAP